MNTKNKIKETIKKATLQLLQEEKQYPAIALIEEVVEKTDYSRQRVSLNLTTNYKNWGLERSIVGKSGTHQIVAYFSSENDEIVNKAKNSIESLRKALEIEKLEEQKARKAEIESRKKEKREKNLITMSSTNFEKTIYDVMEGLIEKQKRFNFTQLKKELERKFPKTSVKQKIDNILTLFENAIDSETGKYEFRQGYVYPK